MSTSVAVSKAMEGLRMLQLGRQKQLSDHSDRTLRCILRRSQIRLCKGGRTKPPRFSEVPNKWLLNFHFCRLGIQTEPSAQAVMLFIARAHHRPGLSSAEVSVLICLEWSAPTSSRSSLDSVHQDAVDGRI